MKDFLELVNNSKGKLITIAARPAMGKSTLAIDIINSVEDGNILYFNLESSARQLIDRIHKDIVHIVDIPGISIGTIESICDTLNRCGNLSLVVVDYLQLVNAFDESKGWNAKERDIVSSLKNIAEKYSVPIILISQLNRSIDIREDRRPTISDISPTLKIDSSIIVSLYSEYRYTRLFNPQVEKKELIDTNLLILKNNNGKVYTDTITFNCLTRSFMEN